MKAKGRIITRLIVIGLLFVLYGVMKYDGAEPLETTAVLIDIGLMLFRNRKDITDYKKGQRSGINPPPRS